MFLSAEAAPQRDAGGGGSGSSGLGAETRLYYERDGRTQDPFLHPVFFFPSPLPSVEQFRLPLKHTLRKRELDGGAAGERGGEVERGTGGERGGGGRTLEFLHSTFISRRSEYFLC